MIRVGIKDCFKVALPLMISSLSTVLMITIDRIMLANYDVMVMNSVAVVGILLFAFEHGATSISSISEVMAGQLSGAKKYDKTAVSAWQMIYFSIAVAFIFVPCGLFLGPYVIPEIFLEYGLDFFKILMSSLFLSSIFSAVAGFFIGTKQTKIIAIASSVSNVLNIILNFTLIFGVKDLIEPMGAKGAAIGTSISLLVQCSIIMCVFLSKKQNEKYNTRNCQFDYKVMVNSLKIGIPNSVSYVMNILGGYTIMLIVVSSDINLVTVHNICMNLIIFMYFTSEGIQKTIIGIGANILGAKEYGSVKRLLLNGIKMQATCLIIFASILHSFADDIIGFYTQDSSLFSAVKIGVPWVLAFYFIDGVLWILGSMLIAGGDTKFITLWDIICVWGGRVLGLYLLHQQSSLDLQTIWQVSCLSNILMISIFICRLKYGKWSKIDMSEV